MSKCPTRDELLSDVLSDRSWASIAEKYGYSDTRFLRKKAKQWNLPSKRKLLKPSKDILSEMLYNQHMTPYQIAQALGYSEGGWANIYAYCREYGLKFDFTINHELRRIPFTPRQQAIVFGTVLGDGYLRPTNSHAQNHSYALSLCHGEKQLEYLRWKFSELENFVTTRDFKVSSRPFHGNSPTYTFSTVSHPFLNEVHHICYSANGKKDITSQWLEHVTPLALAVWYMDDGSLNKRYHTVVLCTNSFSREGQLLAIDFLRERYDIASLLEKRRNGQTVIRINASQSRKFMDIIAPHVPDCMNYKLW